MTIKKKELLRKLLICEENISENHHLSEWQQALRVEGSTVPASRNLESNTSHFVEIKFNLRIGDIILKTFILPYHNP